ncbi:MAG: iron-sulfur cluster carrier protein ApbC [Planctomycetota bacterium]
MSDDTVAAIREALTHVMDPEIGKDLVSLKMIKGVEFSDGTAKVGVELTTPACPLKSKIEEDVRAAVSAVDGVNAVEVDLTAQVRGAAAESSPIPGVRNSIAIASGKGGVGKSTVSTNIAVALAAEGASVGLLDCDIYGPSIPRMTGSEHDRPEADETAFRPLVRHGLSLMSIGYLVPPGESVVWRGPLIHKAVQQFLTEVAWGELDYLIIDLPPGTGDAQLSLTQTIPLTGAVMVTTPQEISLIDVRRGAAMFDKVKVPILGVVENMSGFACPHCDEVSDIFARGGGQRVAREMNVPFLGEVPIDPAVRVGGDDGIPSVVSHPDSASTKAFTQVARSLAGRVSQMNVSGGVSFGQSLPVIK